MRTAFFGLATAVALSFCFAHAAEVGFSTRSSDFHYDWIYGSGGDVRGSNGGASPAQNLLADGAAQIGGLTDQGDEPYLGHWSVTGSWQLTHGYRVGDTRDDVRSIVSSGRSTVRTSVNGPAVSNLTGDTNSLSLEFNVGGTSGSITSFALRTLLNATGPQSEAIVRVDQLGPFGWTAVTIVGQTETGSVGSNFQVLDLQPGIYRIKGDLYVRDEPVNSAIPEASWQYALFLVGETEPDLLPADYIPEPAMLPSAIGMIAVLGRRARRR